MEKNDLNTPEELKKWFFQYSGPKNMKYEHMIFKSQNFSRQKQNEVRQFIEGCRERKIKLD